MYRGFWLWLARSVVFYEGLRLWEARFVVFYESLRLWEAHLYVFYVSGRLSGGRMFNEAWRCCDSGCVRSRKTLTGLVGVWGRGLEVRFVLFYEGLRAWEVHCSVLRVGEILGVSDV